MKISAITFLGVIILTLSCSKPDEEIVAKVGDKKICYDDFIKSYSFEPVYKRGQSIFDARNKQLEQFIDKKLLAYAGEDAKTDTTFFFRERLKWYRKNALVDLYFRHNVEDKINIREKEMLAGFEKQRKNVHVKHLFFHDSLSAKQALADLQNGRTSFEQLANIVFSNEQLKKSGGDLGFCKYGDLEENIEDAAFSLQPGKIYPQIVKSEFGFHIIKAEEIKVNLLATQSAFENQKEDIKRVIKSRKYQQLKQDLVHQMTLENPVQIHLPTFDILVFYAKKTIVKRDEEQAAYIPNVFSEEINQISRKLEDVLQDTLLIVGDEVWSAGRFLQELNKTPPLNRPPIDSEEKLYLTLKYMALDDIIAEKAKSENLEEEATLQTDVATFRDNLIAGEFKSALLESIRPSYSEVNQFYLGKFGKIPDKSSYVYRYTLNRFLNQKRDSLLKHVLDSLSIAHPIEIDKSILFKNVSDPLKKIDFNPTPVYRKKLY